MANPSLHDSSNNERRHKFRSLMRNALTEHVQMDKVEAITQTAELGLWKLFPRDAYNGLYCCIAALRHAYRYVWATIPVVKVAQLEKVVDFPPELNLPWRFLQHKFGVSADSGSNTFNVLLTFDHRGERVYKINVRLGYPVETAEEIFFRLFYDLEVQALPIYHAMVHAVASFREDDKNACLKHLETVSSHLRILLQLFYKIIAHAHVPQSVWLSHTQGFQGWGVGRMIDGGFVKFDGLSGNHVLVFQAIDAFL
ncbi:hypothetical protein FB567DRAFT_624654 [Paraphoma chrysanthemicola]|uniref:Indoleamine 2,3-dioxygenase n=1 Tax=Paraphoma chrysanthemicola TaxID=798071 RepID=A0A8K0RG13_9PLEO|nr:hypothetical protein FB567DRAFT_624654 [Paraphoma chrysanthemicola]